MSNTMDAYFLLELKSELPINGPHKWCPGLQLRDSQACSNDLEHYRYVTTASGWSATRMPDDEAREWFADHGMECPEDLTTEDDDPETD